MVAFVASTVLTAANLNTAFNQKTINTQTGTTYTLVLTDQGGVVTTSNASAVTVTIPPNSSVAFATGTIIDFVNLGAGTLTIAAGAGVTVNGTITALAQYGFTSIIKTGTNTWSYIPAGGGKILQVVQATTAATVTTTSATYVTTGLTGSITPSSASNKIFLLAMFNLTNSAATDWVDTTLFRGTVAGTDTGYTIAVLNNIVPVNLSGLDSPATTSAQTYTVGFKRRSAVTATFNVHATTATLIMMEVAA